MERWRRRRRNWDRLDRGLVVRWWLLLSGLVFRGAGWIRFFGVEKEGREGKAGKRRLAKQDHDRQDISTAASDWAQPVRWMRRRWQFTVTGFSVV